jgi:7-cyano-7-deazaguanine reductase
MAKDTMPKSKLTQLGHKALPAASPDKAKLESVPKPHSKYDYVVRLVCPEFTTLCPITGQPDFAHIVIDYVPGKALVESKSLKLFLQSFRNHGDFHEACTVSIGDRLIRAIAPKWIRVSGYWYPRGGIPIDVFFEHGKLPKTVTVPDTGVQPYRGRG